MPSVISTKRAVSGVLPHDFRRQPPWVIIIKNAQVRAFRVSEPGNSADAPKNNGRNEEPTAGIIDSQSVKGTAESAEESGSMGEKSQG